MRNVILFVNLQKEHARQTVDEIRSELEGRCAAVTIVSFNGHPEPLPDGPWDIGLSLGGDGTVLYAVRSLAPAGTPVLPIHLGTLGFLAGVERHEWLAVYEQWLNNAAKISSRCMLGLSVQRGGLSVYANACLNDIVISSIGNAKLIRLRLKSELSSGEYADIGCYRSDGLIAATPTGSTAYSMAAGGPILDPEMEALVVSPICPFTLSNRPLVLPSRQALLVTVEKEQRSGIVLTVDGQDAFGLEPGDTVTIHQSPHYARLITTGSSSYYTALHEKLWAVTNA